jgi:hypothetical protein
MKTVLLVNVAATLLMCGVIWMVQLVHYPLFSEVGESTYVRYQNGHQTLITLLVGPLMLIEAGTALLLLAQPPQGVPAWMTWAGMALVAVVWGATFFLSVPQHAVLSAGFDAEAHRALVSSNWVRTLAWSGRGVLVLAMVALTMR